MGAGLQVWNASGQLIFDTPDRMGRIVGSATTGTSAGSLNFPIPAGCTGFWFASGIPGIGGMPSISLSGGTLSWTAAANTTIFYGYF